MRSIRWMAVFSVIIGVAAPTATHAERAAAAAEDKQEKKSDRVEAVSSSLVCMVNDRYFGREQIAVQVDGKTYYGCCPMCKDRLAQDAASRKAVDPVSGKTVDKASAVIGRTADDGVFYFESADSLRKFNAGR